MDVDPQTVAARGQIDVAGWERRAAVADLVTPHVTAGTSYIRFSDPFFNFGTGDISSSATSASVEARYSLLGGGKIAELKRARAAVASADASEVAVRFRTLLATDAAYYGVLAEHELARVAVDRLSRALEQLAVARVRVQSGETIMTDSLQLLLEANRAQLEVVRRDSAVTVSRLHLGRRIGLSGPADAAPLDPSLPPALPLTLEQAVADLEAGGPEVEAARAAERRAGAVVTVERGGYLPDVSLSMTTGAYDSQFFPAALTRTQLAITVSVPIWDGGRRELTVARAREEEDVARAVREDRERGAAEEMAQAWKGYETR